jgi:hypothetical protein
VGAIRLSKKEKSVKKLQQLSLIQGIKKPLFSRKIMA